jgi:alpha-1,2-mannosyltransferase
VGATARAVRDALRALARRWAVPGRIAGSAACLLAGPALAAVVLLHAAHAGALLIDFRTAYYPAGTAVLHGHSPYVAASTLHAASGPFVYPAVAAWLFAPLAVLPYTAAAAVYLVVTLGAVAAGLAALGVRDPRCYTVVLAWPVVLSDLERGAVGGLLVLGLAVAWRRRDARSGPVVLGLMCACKPFLWPLLLWPLVIRGVRAAGTAAAAATALLVLPWAAIGFAGLAQYPDLLHALSGQEGDLSYALPSLASALGLPRAAALAVVAGLAGALLHAARRPDRARRERGVMTVCTLLARALSPIVWLDYLLLLAVPVALARPRLAGLWLLPAVMLAAPATHPSGHALPLALAWTVILAVGGASLRARPRRRRATRGAAGGLEPALLG